MPVAEHDFETVATHTVFRGNIIALRTDEVADAGRGHRHPRRRRALRCGGGRRGRRRGPTDDDLPVPALRWAAGSGSCPAGLLDEPGEDPVGRGGT